MSQNKIACTARPQARHVQVWDRTASSFPSPGRRVHQRGHRSQDRETDGYKASSSVTARSIRQGDQPLAGHCQAGIPRRHLAEVHGTPRIARSGTDCRAVLRRYAGGRHRTTRRVGRRYNQAGASSPIVVLTSQERASPGQSVHALLQPFSRQAHGRPYGS